MDNAVNNAINNAMNIAASKDSNPVEWQVNDASSHQMVVTDDVGWLETQPKARQTLEKAFHAASQALWNQLPRPIEVEVMLVSDATMQEYNTAYRQKNESTDVLSFPQLNQLTEVAAVPYPGLVNLGNVVISIDWANHHAARDERIRAYPDPVLAFVVDRLCHGFQHISGLHHDTMDDYSSVIAFQDTVLKAVSAEGEASA